MISEYNMRIAKKIDSEEEVKGYYVCISIESEKKHYIISNCAFAYYMFEIDQNTIKPVKVEVVNQNETISKSVKRGICPNCSNENLFSWQKVCNQCGMALSWKED